jgi:hypothetical protein
MNWRCGSSGGVTTLQAQSSEFKLQYHQKNHKHTHTHKLKEGTVQGLTGAVLSTLMSLAALVSHEKLLRL